MEICLAPRSMQQDEVDWSLTACRISKIGA
jgi:hypothetical protein